MEELGKWLPAFVGLAGGLGSFLYGFWENRKRQKHYVTQDALDTLRGLVEAQEMQLRDIRERERNCQVQLDSVRRELGEARQEVFDLRLELHELKRRTP